MAKGRSKGRKEKAAQESPIQDEKYRLLFESSSDAIMLLDREKFFDCNKATLDMFGLTKEEFIKRHPSEISPSKQPNGKNSREEADGRISEAYEKGVNKFEWVHRRSNGEDFPVTVWLTAFPLEGKKVLQATVREVCHTEEMHKDMEAHRLKLQLMLDEKSEGMKKEVSERRKAETEVKRLIKAVESSFNAVSLFDLDMNLLYANHAFCRMAKISESDITSKKATDFLAPEQMSIVLDNIRNSIAGHEPELMELKAYTTDGQELWVQIASSILFGDDGEPEGVMAIVRDITERKKMLDALKQSEDKFKTMVENSVDGIVIIQDDKIVYMNPSLVRLSGYSFEEQMGREFSDNLIPDERAKIQAAYKARMAGKPVPPVYEISILRKDSRKVPVEINATRMDYLGKPSDFVYVRDLTERRMAEKDIRTIKEQFEYVLGATKTGFDIIDEDLNVLYVDPEWAKKLGDYSGRKCYEYFMGTKQTCEGCAIPRAISTGQNVISEEYLQKEKRFIEVHTIPMKDENGNNMVAEFNIDIDEPKKMLMELQESEEKFRNLAEYSPNMIFINKGSQVVYINRMCEELLGYTREEFLSENFDLMTIIHPEHQDLFRDNLRRHFGGEDIPPYEYKLITKDGESLDSIISTKVIEYGGEPAIMGIVTDVSALKRAENSLRSAEALLRDVLDTIPVRVFWKDRDSKYLGCNLSFAKDSGLSSPEELLGKDDYQMGWQEQAVLYRADDKVVMDSGVSKIGYEEPQTIPEGKRWVRTSKVPLRDSEDNVIGILGTYEDITERKLAEQTLRESEEKYRKLMESANDAIFLADSKTGVLIDANERACKLIGRTRFEIIGMHQTKLHPEEEFKKYEKIFKKHVRDGRAIEETIYVVHKDGHRIPVSISSSIFEISGLIVNQGIFHDLTERIAAEKALRESDEKIRSIFTSLEDIVFGFNIDGVFTSCQSPSNSLLYLPPELFIGKKYSDVLPPHLNKLIDKAVKKNKKHQTMDFEYPLDIEGQERWFSAKMTPLSSEGKFNGSVAVVRDITDKKATEKALQVSEQVYRSLYESTMALGETREVQRIMEVIAEQARNLMDGECSTIYLWDSDKKVLAPYYSNAKTERDKFMAYEMPLGTGLTGQVAKNIEGAYANYNDPKAKKGYVPGTKRITDHLQSIIAEPMQEEGKLLGVINVIAQERVFNDEDLNKLRILAKQAAIAYLYAKNLDELLKSEERFRKMGDSMHDGLIIIENGINTYINERAIEIYGYPLEEMKTMNHLDLVIPEEKEQLLHVLRSFKDTGRMPGEIEFWIQRKDGSRRYLRTRVSTMREGNKTSQFIITTDITDRKLAEDENKRKLMKYLLEDGCIYLVKEFKPAMTLEALNDLLNLDYIGLVISRTPKKDMLRSITGSFEHLWLGEQMEGEELFAKILSNINEMKGKGVIMIDRLDYVIFKYGFKETLAFIFRLRDQIYLREQVVIVSIDPSTLKEDELNIMQKEMSEIELRQVPRPGEELMEIAQLIYDKNSAGIKPSFSEIGEELSLSKPTFRKRVRRLISSGYAVEVTKGNRKVLELTQKGRSLFFK